MDKKNLAFTLLLEKSLRKQIHLPFQNVIDYLSDLYDNPIRQITYNYNINEHTETRYIDLNFIAMKTIIFYNKIDLQLRIKYLDSFLVGKNANVKYWVRILFSDYNNYVKVNNNYEQLLYLFSGTHADKKQGFISKLLVEQFNKSFRNINFQSRRVLLDKLMQNHNLASQLQKLILKNLEFIPKAQLIFFYDNICESRYRFKLSKLI